jgi:hypothetical protein
MVTKFPVTCAAKSPWRPKKPTASTKPLVKLKRAAMESFLIHVLFAGRLNSS